MTLDEAELWRLVGFLKGGGHRYDVFVYLAKEGPSIPSEIAEGTEKSDQRVYDGQKELEEEDLIELRVPDDMKKGRLRALTDRGREVWEFMVEEGIEDENEHIAGKFDSNSIESGEG